MKYIVYGWAYIQDMLEHAIIMEQTGMEEDIGVEVQQFPYPCYTWDRYHILYTTILSVGPHQMKSSL